MKPGSKYYPLFQHLQQCDREETTLLFAEIETLLCCSLPNSAFSKKNWWSNRDSASAPLDRTDSNYSLDKGNPGDLCPPYAKQQLANLGHWQEHDRQNFPEELLTLRLFKCRRWQGNRTRFLTIATI